MYIVKLQNEFLHGAIWVYGDDGVSTSYPLVDKDPQLQALNKETACLFNSYFKCDADDSACFFDEDLEKETADQMRTLILKIKNRLNEINDGSFVVEDYILEG